MFAKITLWRHKSPVGAALQRGLSRLSPLQPLAYAAGMPTTYLEFPQAVPEQDQVVPFRRRFKAWIKRTPTSVLR